MNRGFLVALSVALVTAAACNNNNSDTTTGPSPAAPSISETFNGTVPLLDTHNGSDSHNFTVTQSGEVTVTLNSAGPPATIQMGIGIGAPTTTTCPHTIAEGRSIQAGPNLVGDFLLNAGTFCVDVFDVGNAAAAISYTVTIAHP